MKLPTDIPLHIHTYLERITRLAILAGEYNLDNPSLPEEARDRLRKLGWAITDLRESLSELSVETPPYLIRLSELALKIDPQKIIIFQEILRRCLKENRRLILCGNGGSAATASHLVCDLQKNIPTPWEVIALTDNPALLTAWANDVNYESIFSRQLALWARPEDVVLLISGSGNSPNILEAARQARKAEAIILALTGFEGGALLPLADHTLVVPSDNMQHIEDLHLAMGHLLFSFLRDLPG